MTNLTPSLKVLRAHYKELTGRSGRKLERNQLEAQIAAHLRQQDRHAAEALEREQRLDARQARREERADFEAFLATDHDRDSDNHRVTFLVRRCHPVIEQAAIELEKFKASLEENPLYALSWADRLYDMVAAGKVAQEVIAALMDGATSNDVQGYAIDQALRGAASPGRSTSATSNRAEEAETKAWADFARRNRC